MITLIIARHGNTFAPHETPTRVGARTDLPLVEKGLAQGTALGLALKKRDIIPANIYASTLQRTQQTAKTACDTMEISPEIEILHMLDEVDYGPDENKPETDVITRIGEKAIQDWDADAVVPDGWNVTPDNIIQDWQNFAERLAAQNKTANNQTHLVVTSNGIARFAPYITGDFEAFKKSYPLKLATGAYGILEFDNKQWTVKEWNTRPPLI